MPPTRHSLGKPLPYQQADRPQAIHQAQKLYSISLVQKRGYQELVRFSTDYACLDGILPTCYGPVRHSPRASRETADITLIQTLISR